MTGTHTRPRRSVMADPVGALLRQWRAARRMSQLDLALEANVSSRHLSFVETGKSQASREMIMKLAHALAMPLRERNALLVAAGYAPMYAETPLTTPELERVRGAMDLILQQQEPYPAYVIDRYWDLVRTNASAQRLIGALRTGGAHGNVVRQVFDPNDIRAAIVNWEEVASDLMRHLHAQVAASPSDDRAGDLLAEALSYPDVPRSWRTRELGTGPAPLLTIVLRTPEHDVRFFSTITTFGTPRDVTLDELHIECWFPVDDVTARFCEALATPSP